MKGELASQSDSATKDRENNKSLQQSLLDKVKEGLKKVEEIKKANGEKDETIEMLNAIIDNKNSEIQKLKDEKTVPPISELLPNTHTCEQCDFRSESEKGLKIHMGRMHEVTCDACNEKFAGQKKLNTHMCRIHLKNPSIEFLYMKNWYLKHECIRVFCNSEKKLLAILHSRNCIETNNCTDFPTNLDQDTPTQDIHGIIHTFADKIINFGTVKK